MTNRIEQLRKISSQAQADEIARDEARRLLTQSETKARITQKIDYVHSRALEAAQKGDTSLTVLRLDVKTYGIPYPYERHKIIAPDVLQGDDKLVAETLVKEGFEIFIGYVEPEHNYKISGTVYNYLGITWRENTDRIKS